MAGSVTVRELLTKFRFKVDKKALDSLKSKLEGIKSSLEAVRDAMIKVAAVAAAVTAAFVAQGFVTAQLAQSIILQADALGITSDAYQEMTFTLEQFGLQSEKVSEILGRISMKMADAGRGAASALDIFGAFGITMADIRGKTAHDVLLQIADASAQMTDDGKRMDATYKLFGNNVGSKLLPILRQGRDGFEAFARSAQLSGAVFDEKKLLAAKRFGDVISDIESRIGLVRFSAGFGIVDSLEDATARLSALFDLNRDGIVEFVEDFSAGIGDGIKVLVTGFKSAIKSVDQFRGSFKKLVKKAGFEKLSEFFDGIEARKAGFLVVMGGITAAVAALALTVGILAVGLVIAVGAMTVANIQLIALTVAGIAAAVAIGVMFDDIATYFRGGESLFGDMIDGFSAKIRSFVDYVKGIGSTITSSFASGVRGLLGYGPDGYDVQPPEGGIATQRLVGGSSVAGSNNGTSSSSTSSVNNTVGGDTITINGVGIDARQAESIASNRQASKHRQAMQLFAGGQR